MHSIPRPCARRNVLLPRWVSLHLILPRGQPPPVPVAYGPPQWARPSYTKGVAGADFSFQPDGTLRCPAGRPLYAAAAATRAQWFTASCSTQRGSAIVERVRCASSVKKRRPPSKRGGSAPSIGLSLHMHRFQVSPHLPQGTLHLHWLLIRCVFRDWQRRSHRRELVKLLRHQHIDIGLAEPSPPVQSSSVRPLSRTERAGFSSLLERSSGTQCPPRSAASVVSITLFGIPNAFAATLGLHVA
jgi:hypothetical protein